MSVPPDDPMRRVADLPPPADQAAAVHAYAEASVGASRAIRKSPEIDTRTCATDIRAGQAVGACLGAMLQHVFIDEPPIADAVEDVFRRAAIARRRRSRTALALGSVIVLLVTALGYALTAVLLPASPTQSPAAESVVLPPRADPVLALLAPVLAPSRLRAVPREPSHGAGWRQYLVLAPSGHSHGLIEISVYAAPGRLCFPVLADRSACARPERTAAGVEYARYAFDRDIDWQVNEAIARRGPDGRVVVVQATGERGTGSAQAGRPSLTGQLAANVAADPRMAAAFGVREVCTGPAPACPVLKVAVPIAK